MSDFGNNLRNLRKSRNLTLEELAEKLSINKSTLSRYESGQREPNHEAEENIADFFNVSLDALRGYEPIDYSVLNSSPETQMVLSFMEEMDEPTRQNLLAYAEYLWRMNKKGGDN